MNNNLRSYCLQRTVYRIRTRTYKKGVHKNHADLHVLHLSQSVFVHSRHIRSIRIDGS